MDDKVEECPSKAFAALIFGYTTIISKHSFRHWKMVISHGLLKGICLFMSAINSKVCGLQRALKGKFASLAGVST